ncbi:MAG: right-handed parallel beta-helix repeat-containing protein, partial [Candidatus Marinimicrobia bacterium]|nr:right-handed parallel beta-helix repeat-containing protein [Candidatus Neomarinimicrobiota bacterium]
MIDSRHALLITLAVFLTLGHLSAQTVTGIVTLTDVTGTEALNFPEGDTLYVKLVDSDRDLDNLIADQVSVSLSSAFETTTESLTLTETDLSSGLFMGWMLFDAVSGLAVTDGVLQVEQGNQLTVSYTDPADDFGNQSILTDNAYYNVSLASGIIAVNTTWTKATSPYLVTGDVTVNPNITLTIEPGVEVRFQPVSDDQSGGLDANRTELRIRGGTLRAEGTVTDSIIFTSNAEVPGTGDWYGIVQDSLNNGSINGHVIITYSRFEYHSVGINAYGYSDPSIVDTIRVEHSHFRQGGRVISSQNGDYRYIVFNDNLVDDGGGIYFPNQISGAIVKRNIFNKASVYFGNAQGATQIRDNSFSGIGPNQSEWAIRLNSSRGAEITGNTLTSTLYGISVYNTNGGSYLIADNSLDSVYNAQIQIQLIPNITIRNNTITNGRNNADSYAGIYIGNWDIYSTQAVIRGNTITGGNSPGMFLNRVSGIIDSNIVQNNARGGIYLNGEFGYSSIDSILYNTVTGNGAPYYGIYLTGYTRPVLQYNNLHDNSSYDVYGNISASTLETIDARFNWWGATTTADFDAGGNPKNVAKIYDLYDDANKGFVNYGGWLDGTWPGGNPTAVTQTGFVTLTDVTGTEALNFPEGDTLYVKLVDSDRDLDNLIADQVSVSLSSA